MRVHDACFTSEVLGSLKCDCAEQLALALEHIRDAPPGMVVYLQQEGRGIGLANKIAAYALQERGLDTVDANRALGLPDDCREYSPVAFILSELRVASIQLMVRGGRAAGVCVRGGGGLRGVGRDSTGTQPGCLWAPHWTPPLLCVYCPLQSPTPSPHRPQTNNPRKISEVEALGVRVTGRIPCLVEAQEYSAGYLAAKRRRMSHIMGAASGDEEEEGGGGGDGDGRGSSGPSAADVAGFSGTSPAARHQRARMLSEQHAAHTRSALEAAGPALAGTGAVAGEGPEDVELDGSFCYWNHEGEPGSSGIPLGEPPI